MDPPDVCGTGIVRAESRREYREYWTCLNIGLLFGLAMVSKPVALVVAGLLIPNIHSRASRMSWMKESTLIAAERLSRSARSLCFSRARESTCTATSIGVINYGGSPGFIVFGPARLAFFRFLTHLQSGASVIGDFRTSPPSTSSA